MTSSSLALGERREAHADPSADGGLERPVDAREASLDVGDVDGADPAHELVAP